MPVAEEQVLASQEEAPPPNENCTFVLNVARLVDSTAFDLAPGHQLRRATREEVARIKEVVSTYARRPFAASMWEWRVLADGKAEHLPEEEWRYFVISFLGNNNATLLDLENAFNLAPTELEVGFTIITGPGGFSGLAMNPDQLYHVVAAARWDEIGGFFLDVTREDVAAISLIRTQLQQHDRALIDASRLAQQLGQLKALPHGSPLRFLGYFALLESVLTHSPKPNDPYDSITRQVKHKLQLLDNRWQQKIDYSSFGNAQPETIWTKMYEYRSQLAHGSRVDTDAAGQFRGSLAALGNHVQAMKLLKLTTKAVVRHALIESQLLVDLREC